MTGAALIAQIREFHKDCAGCPVEQMCDEYEAALNGAVIQLTEEQASEVRDYLGRIIDSTTIFSSDHQIYDDAYAFHPWFVHKRRVTDAPVEA